MARGEGGNTHDVAPGSRSAAGIARLLQREGSPFGIHCANRSATKSTMVQSASSNAPGGDRAGIGGLRGRAECGTCVPRGRPAPPTGARRVLLPAAAGSA
ncbi:Hypothetical protein I596_2424 [Dokdonella koreensis DS-123]|uniref:Uncharacterized protein n=1 Tax=Dokdonella koreensis DS-123 TaxID=1300342 RepID=A0A167H0V1_9GAMM|nr:Hypothetical protein I596_2424 [Dokdonella koreensis DS-123]